MSEANCKPTCPHCSQLNCVACIAAGYMTRITAVAVELPKLDVEQRQRDRDAAPLAALHLAVHETLHEMAIRSLRVMSTGRFSLCSDHALPPTSTEPVESAQRLVEAVRATGFDPTNIVGTLMQTDPAVMRHTLQRFARLWQDVRDIQHDLLAGKPVDVSRGSAMDELDELARGVLS